MTTFYERAKAATKATFIKNEEEPTVKAKARIKRVVKVKDIMPIPTPVIKQEPVTVKQVQASPLVQQPVTVQRLPLARLYQFKPYMGCDPEFFFKVDNNIVGAELFIPKEGIKNNLTRLGGLHTALKGTETKFIIDGVQVELNPKPDTCRANLANEISVAFKTLKAELTKQGTKVQCDFSRSITIEKTDLDKLDANNQKFGCMPSLNSHKDTECKLTKVDPLVYRQRSAGGHIHIGFDGQPNLKTAITENPDEMVDMLDIICGNTMVLIDRDPGNKARRELYGRAGEYRLPKHGIEYRTLSNFWLTHYYLMSFAFGMARLAVNLCAEPILKKRYIEEFKSKVDMKEIQDAINNNDFDLAYSNFKKIEPLLMEVLPEYGEDNGINTKNMPQFHYFVRTVNEHGLSYWLTEDPVEHWCNLPEAHPDGFCHFLGNQVDKKMREVKVG